MAKASNPEDEYFAREDAEKKRRIALQMKKELDATQRQALKEMHHMCCPHCGMKLQTVRKGKIDVDACFSCGGVFLDKKDLDAMAASSPKGIMGAILTWFKEETRHPVK
jgi:Zn-finger nucleic acid-binding protein